VNPTAALARIAELLRHDARNPLYAMALSNRILRSGAASTREEGGRLSERAQTRVETMVKQLEMLSTFAIDAVQPEAARVDLAGLLSTSMRAAGPSASEAELNLPPPSDARIYADPGLTRFVLQTVLHNAITHGTGPVSVHASVSQRGGAEITIRHAGQLRPDSDQLFDPLRSCGRADTQAGLGLGLALSFMAVDAQGGYLSVSADDGHVSTHLTLPEPETR